MRRVGPKGNDLIRALTIEVIERADWWELPQRKSDAGDIVPLVLRVLTKAAVQDGKAHRPLIKVVRKLYNCHIIQDEDGREAVRVVVPVCVELVLDWASKTDEKLVKRTVAAAGGNWGNKNAVD